MQQQRAYRYRLEPTADQEAVWNQVAETMEGWSHVEALGQPSHTLLKTVLPQPLNEITAMLMQTEHSECELTHARRDETQIAVESRWVVQRNEQGQPIRVLEINTDITECKQAELARAPVPHRWWWTLGHVLLLLGGFVLVVLGGVWTDAQYQIDAARGDSDVPAPTLSAPTPGGSSARPGRPTPQPAPSQPPFPIPALSRGSAVPAREGSPSRAW